VHHDGRMAVAARVVRVSTTFRRSVDDLGVAKGSPTHRAVTATMRALAKSSLPGAGDFETAFAPAKAYVRRVAGQNLWLLYRFDDDHVFVMTVRGEPPVPLDE
jgi:hypothetical protein